MEKQNSEHIEDDFLRNLVKKSTTILPSAGFTERVMEVIPKTNPFEVAEKEGFKPWYYAAIATGFVAVVYFIITFDLTSFFKQVAESEGKEGINYVNLFGVVLNTFNKAFSNFHFTSISLMIVISGVILYFGDKLLKKWAKGNADTTFA